MVTGVGTPLPDLLSRAQSLLEGTRAGIPGQPAKAPFTDLQQLDDLIDISDSARQQLNDNQRALEALSQIPDQLRSSDLEFSGRRLQELQEQISVLRSLVQAAGSEQADIINRAIAQTGRQLNELSEQIRSIATGIGGTQVTRTQLIQGELSISFNAEVSNGQGSASVSQELNIEFSLLRSTSEENGRRVELVAAELDISFEQTVVVENTAETNRLAEDLRNIIREFQNTTQDFLSLVSQATEQFGKERIPPGLLRLVEKFLESGASAPETKPQENNVVDRLA